jgi:GTP cyclohydrolase II
MKINALRDQGISIGETIALPEELVPADARVEIEAKVAAGYLGGEAFRTDAPSIGRTLVE